MSMYLHLCFRIQQIYNSFSVTIIFLSLVYMFEDICGTCRQYLHAYIYPHCTARISEASSPVARCLAHLASQTLNARVGVSYWLAIHQHLAGSLYSFGLVKARSVKHPCCKHKGTHVHVFTVC